MQKGLIEVVFILDRSGFMNELEGDTIGGFNSMIEKQRKEEGEAYITTVLFDDQVEILHDRIPVKKVEPMTAEQYYVRGMTALLDAIGSSVDHISNINKYAREEDRTEKTLFIITTDGLENASHNYDYAQVKKMVEKEQDEYGWEFLFLGANMDAIEVAGRFGIRADRAIDYEYDSEGTALNYQAWGDVVSAVRNSESKEETERLMQAACTPVREDYKKRHGAAGERRGFKDIFKFH